MKLIREEIEQVEFIVENKNGKKSLFIEGVFLQGNIKNRNGRMYPMETLRREVARYNENHVLQGFQVSALESDVASDLALFLALRADVEDLIPEAVALVELC